MKERTPNKTPTQPIDLNKKLMQLLSRRDYSRARLREHLLTKGYLIEDIEGAINEFELKGLFSEERYIEVKLRGWIRKGCGPNYIQNKLYQEDINLSQEEIISYYEAMETTVEECARQVLTKKLKTIKITVEKRKALKFKMVNFLKSKGFDYKDFKAAIDASF